LVGLKNTLTKEEEEEEKKNKTKKKTKKKNKTKKKKKTTRKTQTYRSVNGGGETFCFVCTDCYSNSVARETWVQCTRRQIWLSVKCSAGVPWETFAPNAIWMSRGH
jgi:hypothetical protein